MTTDENVSRIAAAIGEPARARMLYCLLDGHARTSTELAVVAEVSPSTASVHLDRLKTERLVKVQPQGKHRYYSLEGPNVARALEGLSILAGRPRDTFTPNTPSPLRAARTCYDHIAGSLGVALHDRMSAMRWISLASGNGELRSARSNGDDEPSSGRANGDDETRYDVTRTGEAALGAMGIDVNAARALRRRFAYPCLDWSERRPHLGGALGAALLNVALKRKWVVQDLDSRILEVTPHGRRELRARFAIVL